MGNFRGFVKFIFAGWLGGLAKILEFFANNIPHLFSSSGVNPLRPVLTHAARTIPLDALIFLITLSCKY